MQSEETVAVNGGKNGAESGGVANIAGGDVDFEDGIEFPQEVEDALKEVKPGCQSNQNFQTFCSVRPYLKLLKKIILMNHKPPYFSAFTMTLHSEHHTFIFYSSFNVRLSRVTISSTGRTSTQLITSILSSRQSK